MYTQYLTKSQCCRDVCSHRPRRGEFYFFHLSAVTGKTATQTRTGTLGPLTSINS